MFSIISFNNRRSVSGVILIDKPSGISSNKLLKKIIKLFNANKAGHAGTLDPIATGMFPICFGEATKFSQYLLNSDKIYRVIAKLGERTDTSDSEGKIISVRSVKFNENHLLKALNQFRGRIYQIPSIFSALKYHGQPLYKYARKGIQISRKAREIYIYNLKLIYWNMNKIELEIHCSKGTYIRTIIDDLGELLGCGAHVIMLRRLKMAKYSETCMITFKKLQNIASSTHGVTNMLSKLDKLILPIDSMISDMPLINLPNNISTLLQFGQTVAINTSLNGFVRMANEKQFFGVGEIKNQGYLSPRRLIKK